jgi:hypothetical protein
MALRRITAAALALSVLAAASLWPAPAAHANVFGALADLFQGVIALPMNVLAGTFSGPPVIGTINGVLAGTVNTLSYTTRGLLGLAGAAIPAASALAPFLPFVL